MALTPNDRKIIDDFREKLTTRLIADRDGKTTLRHRADSALALVGAGDEYRKAVLAAHSAASD
ncbi:hypothetical protein [Bradyrhizobium sp.]|uniref:hypothetical protein n=1 Tax=Bradyrhizobium sp. TaxID=376 RepID=UPI001D371DFA|nr:hypothetical protein [Bradyrhizobium sp.]MBI5322668.1 hypothetical protein [Bradyrhizobium sp.]